MVLHFAIMSVRSLGILVGSADKFYHRISEIRLDVHTSSNPTRHRWK